MSSPAAAWKRFCKLVASDIPESELAMMPLEDLQAVMNAFNLSSPVEMARIEVQWKVLQKQNLYTAPAVRREIYDRVLTDNIAQSITDCQEALYVDEHLRQTTHILSPPRPDHCAVFSYGFRDIELIENNMSPPPTVSRVEFNQNVPIFSPDRKRSASVGRKSKSMIEKKPLHDSDFEIPIPQLEKCLQKKKLLGSVEQGHSDPNYCVKLQHNSQKETGKGCFSPVKCWGETSHSTELSEIKLCLKKIPDPKTRRGNPSEMATDAIGIPNLNKHPVTGNPNATKSKQGEPLPKAQKKTFCEKNLPLQGKNDQYVRTGKVVSDDLPRPNITIPHKVPLQAAGVVGQGDPNILGHNIKDSTTGRKLNLSHQDNTQTPPWFGVGPKPPVPNPRGKPEEGIMPWDNNTIPMRTNKAHLKGRPDASIVETNPPAPSQRRRAVTRNDSGVMPGATGWALG